MDEDEEAERLNRGCGICLQRVHNRTFISHCDHTFCYTCVAQWSKVKPECPLCKTPFNAIFHSFNVDDFKITSMEKEIVVNTNTDNDFRREQFARRTDGPGPSRSQPNQRLIELLMLKEMELIQEQLPLGPDNVFAEDANLEQMDDFENAEYMLRRHVYNRRIWGSFKYPRMLFRMHSLDSFKQNPKALLRLLPWLFREFQNLFPYKRSQKMSTMSELVVALASYDIWSQEFYYHLSGKLGERTGLFIHEFQMFAMSPFDDVKAHDEHIQYVHFPRMEFSVDSVPEPSFDRDLLGVEKRRLEVQVGLRQELSLEDLQLVHQT